MSVLPLTRTLTTTCLLAVAHLCVAAEFSGKVVGISDGDTITVLRDGNVQVKVRLNGIDCPESGQAFGSRAKEFTSSKAFGQVVRVAVLEQDKYGRSIADVYLPDGSMLNAELVRAGLAWWYRKYAPDDEVLAQLEAVARVAKAGLWADSNPMPPWDYRLNPSGGVDPKPTAPATSSETPRPTASPSTTPAPATATVTVYVTRTGSKYHRAGCRYLKSIIPMSLSDAKRLYSPCSVCRPPG